MFKIFNESFSFFKKFVSQKTSYNEQFIRKCLSSSNSSDQHIQHLRSFTGICGPTYRPVSMVSGKDPLWNRAVTRQTDLGSCIFTYLAVSTEILNNLKVRSLFPFILLETLNKSCTNSSLFNWVNLFLSYNRSVIFNCWHIDIVDEIIYSKKPPLSSPGRPCGYFPCEANVISSIHSTH
jgi:hypothetical protein